MLKSKTINKTINKTVDKINVDKLILYLTKKYGSDIIIKSENVSDKNTTIYINKDKMFDITYKTFFEIKSSYNENYITLDQLISFLVNNNNGGANTSATCGKYHEFMQMVFELCNVTIKDDMPNYENIDPQLKQIIIPSRDEYIICWWIINKISNDLFIKNFLFINKKNISWAIFQYNYDGKFYDVSFDYLGIIIEIQEDKIAHQNNPNDKLKETIIKFNGKRIKYFKLQEYRKKTFDYLDDFWNNTLKKSIIEALLYKEYDARKLFCSNRFIEICNDEMQLINNEVRKLYDQINLVDQDKKIRKSKILRFNNLKEKSTRLKAYINRVDTSLINKLFEWKNESEKMNNQYIINVEDICVFFNYDSTSINKLINIIYTNGILFIINNDEYYISWKSLVELLKLKDIFDDQLIIKQLDHYLLNIERIYEEIIINIKIHTTEIINNNADYNESYIKYIKHKIEDPLIKQINKLSSENLNFQYEIKMVCSQIKKLTKLSIKQNTLCETLTIDIKQQQESKQTQKQTQKQKQESKQTQKQTQKQIQQVKDLRDIRESLFLLKKYHNNNVGNIITVQKIAGKSIIKEIPEFPIIYTGKIEHKMLNNNFIGICRAYLISISNQKKIYQELYNDSNIDTSIINILHYIKDISDDDIIHDQSEQDNIIVKKIVTIDQILKSEFIIDESDNELKHLCDNSVDDNSVDDNSVDDNSVDDNSVDSFNF